MNSKYLPCNVADPLEPQHSHSGVRTWVLSPHVAFDDALEASLINQQGRRYSENSREEFRSMFRQFCRFILERQLSILEIDWTVIAVFLESRGLCELAYKKRSDVPIAVVPVSTQVNLCVRYIKLISIVMDYLVFIDYRTDNAAQDDRLKFRAVHQRSIRYRQSLTPQQDVELQRRLLASFPGPTWQERRDCAMVLFMLGTGATSEETRSALVKQFDFSEGLAKFRSENARVRDRTITLDDICTMPMRLWLEESKGLAFNEVPALAFPASHGHRTTATSLFLIVQKTVARVSLNALHACPTILRNTWCQRQLLNGVDRQLIQQQLGLTSSKTVDEVARQLTRSAAPAPSEITV